MDNDENIYRIDLRDAATASNLIYTLSSYLEKEETKNKKILLQMNDIDLNVAQLKSIRSLINSIDSSLSFVSTNSEVTKASAMALEIIITDENTTQAPQLEPEKTYKTLDEVIEEQAEVKEEKPEVISIETDEFTHEDAQNALESIFEDPFADKKEEPAEEIEEVVEENGEETPSETAAESAEEETSTEEKAEETTAEETNEFDSLSPLSSIFGEDKQIEEILNVKETSEDVGLDVEYYKNFDNEFTQEDLEIDNLQTMYIKQTLRSGQVINYEGNVVIIGDCHTGSEIHATGDITVWGILNGIAHAGSGGNTRAKIRALKMNAIQLRIADSYARKPDALNTVLMEKSNVFTPEEARCINGDIIIFKIND